MQQRKDIKMNWFNEIQGNKAAEVFNDATKVAADYSLRLWEKQVETARSFADRNTSRLWAHRILIPPKTLCNCNAAPVKRNWPNGGARWKNFPNWPMTLVKNLPLLPTRVSMFGINPCRMPPKNHRFYSPTVYKRMPT